MGMGRRRGTMLSECGKDSQKDLDGNQAPFNNDRDEWLEILQDSEGDVSKIHV